MQMVALLYWLGDDERKRSVCIQYRCISLSLSSPQLAESTEMENQLELKLRQSRLTLQSNLKMLNMFPF